MFIAADGINYEDANSYASVDYADSYFSLRGITAWTGSDAVKQAALIRATDYIDQTYGQSFIGIAANNPQGLAWPRYILTGAYEIDFIPEALKKATCELALEALSGQLNPIITRERAVKREKVDVLEVEYSDTGTLPTIRPAVNGYLSSLLAISGLNRKVVRV